MEKIKRTSSGSIDMGHYQRKARRLRAQKAAEIFRKVISIFNVKKKITQ
jgi:hypothetical protein